MYFGTNALLLAAISPHFLEHQHIRGFVNSCVLRTQTIGVKP
jgi:hypothetical protein